MEKENNGAKGRIKEWVVMKKPRTRIRGKENNFWEDGGFVETLSSEEAREKMKTFHKRHDEDMNFNCKRCSRKISVHNKDWHAGMCDDCFNKNIYGEQTKLE